MYTLHEDRHIYIRQCCEKLFLETETFPNEVADKIKKGAFCLDILTYLLHRAESFLRS